MSAVDTQVKSIVDALLASPDKNIADTHVEHEHSAPFFHTVQQVLY